MYHIVNTILLGHLGNSTYVAGLGLGGLTIGIAFLSISVSFAGSLDTLVSQAFGEKNFALCATYLNR